MRHLMIGVFHDETLGKELGKKGTLSAIAMYNRKSEEYIFTVMSPVEDKLTAKSQIISAVDAAIVVFSQMTRELGETILLLDLIGKISNTEADSVVIEAAKPIVYGLKDTALLLDVNAKRTRKGKFDVECS